MHYVNVIDRLERSLKSPLPGSVAHDRLSPQPRRQWPEGFHPSRVRNAAGLLLVFPVAGRAHVVLTVRAGTLERHSGQVSLPGGVVDPGETFDQAALREAHEEVALPLSAVRVLGDLTPLDIPVSGFRLHPILAAADERLPLKPAAGEVAAILEIPVEDLLNPAHLRSTDRERDGRRFTIPAFFVAGHEIWGATAMVLAEFLALLGWPSDF
jgi:8-oxo-dGTP pyrophosphatase MutT (NUDIX family)